MKTIGVTISRAVRGRFQMVGLCLLAAGAMASAEAQTLLRGKAWASANSSGQLLAGFNSTGAANTISHTGAGIYTVTYTGLAAPATNGAGGMSQVVSNNPATRCHSATYVPQGNDIVQTIYCADYAGNMKDSAYSSLYYREAGTYAHRFDAYAWNDQSTPAAPFSANSGWSWNSTGGANTIARTSTGVYTVTFGGMAAGPNSGAVMVTASGFVQAYCNPQGWTPSGQDVVATIQCFDPTGAPQDNHFVASFLTDVALGIGSSSDPATGAYAEADQPSAASYVPAAAFSLTSSGGAAFATRTSAGFYSMNFAGIPPTPNGVAFASGYASDESCSAGPITSGNGVSSITLACNSPLGAATDTKYEILYLTETAPAAVSGVTSIPGLANAISAGADGSVYIVGTNYQTGPCDTNGCSPAKFDGSEFQQILGSGTRLAVDPNGVFWLVNANNGIYKYTGPNSQDSNPVPGAATDIAIGADGSIFIVGATSCDVNGCPPYRFNGSSFQKLPGSGVRVAADQNGVPWLVNANHGIYRYESPTSGDSDQITGSATAISIGPDGSVYIVGTTPCDANGCTIYKFDGTSFQPMKGLTGVEIAAAPNGVLWIITRSGGILRYSANSGPQITSVFNSSSGAINGAQNTWMAIQGANLGPVTRLWQASDFVGGQMPVVQDNVSVMWNGKPAFVYYISDQQVNVLTPVDSTIGPVSVVLKNANGITSAFSVPMATYSPSLFTFDAKHAAAEHASGSFLGPATLFPGLNTPAAPGEVVVLFAEGLGPITPAVVNGSPMQAGTTVATPSVTVNGTPVKLLYSAAISPGLYQLNIMLPAPLANGDYPVVIKMPDGSSSQPTTVITVQN